MVGNINRATEFSMKIVPSDTAISCSSASMIGPTAAIALPPQIAVPADIRKETVCSTARQPGASPANIEM